VADAKSLAPDKEAEINSVSEHCLSTLATLASKHKSCVSSASSCATAAEFQAGIQELDDNCALHKKFGLPVPGMAGMDAALEERRNAGVELLQQTADLGDSLTAKCIG
jgi:hypothetical protein